MDVMVFRPLCQWGEQNPKRSRNINPCGKLIPAMPHHVDPIHGPEKKRQIDRVPCRLEVDVYRKHGVERCKCEGYVEQVAVGCAEDGQIAVGGMVPLMHSPVQGFEVVHERMDREEIGVVEDHHHPCEEETAQNVARELHPA